jgi:NodT family efflux transporter outer membrane factor (OMF) lipoprotein
MRTCSILFAAALAGCAGAPGYDLPATPSPAAFKEVEGWSPAAPADALDRGPWWTLFNDPVLDGLASQVALSNQNVAAAVAAYAQARAQVAQQRAALFPAVGLDAGAQRSGGDTANRSNYRLDLGLSWEPDVFGRLRSAVSGAAASAQASRADLASATLAAQGELVANYFVVRQLDAQRALLATTIEGYERVLEIARNRYDAGIVAKADVLQAETQLANARSDELSLKRQRAEFEHAIAILLGRAPAEFSLAPAPWNIDVPEIPAMVPSVLLQRRPDIASAERRVAAANAQIGVARAAYFPSFGLSAAYGTGGTRVSDLFSVSSAVWSFGLSAAQTLFSAGATRAGVEAARARHEEAVAVYRQTVLNAFADVENQLAASAVLARQQALREQAARAATQVEQQMLNRYKAGQVSYTEVVQAQATALSARRALVQAQSDRQTTAVALIQALGGGWRAP